MKTLLVFGFIAFVLVGCVPPPPPPPGVPPMCGDDWTFEGRYTSRECDDLVVNEAGMTTGVDRTWWRDDVFDINAAGEASFVAELCACRVPLELEEGEFVNGPVSFCPCLDRVITVNYLTGTMTCDGDFEFELDYSYTSMYFEGTRHRRVACRGTR